MGMGKTIEMIALVEKTRELEDEKAKHKAKEKGKAVETRVKQEGGLSRRPKKRQRRDSLRGNGSVADPLVLDDSDETPVAAPEDDEIRVIPTEIVREQEAARKRHQTLVICPKAVLDQWFEELRSRLKIQRKVHKFYGTGKSTCMELFSSRLTFSQPRWIRLGFNHVWDPFFGFCKSQERGA